MDKIEKRLQKVKTKYSEGFTTSEIKDVLKLFPYIKKDKFYDALTGCTGRIIEGNFITYYCDILKAVYCGIENRALKHYEWD